MIGTKFYKPLQDDYIQVEKVVVEKDENGNDVEHIETESVVNDAPNTLSKYAQAAEWCNANKAIIEDKGDCYEVVALPEPTEEELQAQALAQAKSERAAEVERLTVEVEGMVFDADETSQARMSVAASSMTDDETNVWVLHDNSVVQVTKAQLLQACRLARIAQSAVWTKPYENASA